MKNKNLEILNKLYKNTSMGISALSTIIPKTEDIKLKGELQAQLDNYHRQSEELRKQIYTNNAKPKDIGVVVKASADASIIMSTALNKSTSHIAEMMIQGTNMGVIDINKTLNQVQFQEQGIIQQAQAILKSEQEYIDKLKAYL